MTTRPNPAGLRPVPELAQLRLRPSMMIDRVSAETGIPVKSLRRAIDKGKLEGYYTGRSIAVFVDSVATFQEANRVPSKAAAIVGPAPKPKVSARPSPAQDAAVEFLRANGVNPGT